MYKLIGADGREYGPVSLEQLRQWITEGRVNAATKVQPAGRTEWQPVSTLPEFASVFVAAPPPVTTPPLVTAPVNAEALAAEILTRDYQLRIGDCLSRGWELVKNNFWLLVGAEFVIGLIIGAVGIVTGPLCGGANYLFLKRIRNQPAQFSDCFAGFTLAFLPLFLGFLVMYVLGVIAFFCCVIPCIYLVVSWSFALPLIIDKKLEFWPAMELSRKVVGQHWWKVFGLLLVNVLLTCLGFLLCCVGVFVTAPISRAMTLYAYEDIFSSQPVETKS